MSVTMVGRLGAILPFEEMGDRDGSAHMGSSKTAGTKMSPRSSRLDTRAAHLQVGWSVLAVALTLAALGTLFAMPNQRPDSIAVGLDLVIPWPSRCPAR